MTVKELINLLDTFDKDLEVVVHHEEYGYLEPLMVITEVYRLERLGYIDSLEISPNTNFEVPDI